MLRRIKSACTLAFLSSVTVITSYGTQAPSKPNVIPRITGRVDLIRISAQENSMKVSELFLLDENPHGTNPNQNSTFTFRIFIPSVASIQECIVENDKGDAVVATVSPSTPPGEYTIQLPYHPGGIKTQVVYQLPYSESLDLEARPSVTQETLAVMLPKSMHFESEVNEFEAVESDQAVNVYVVKKAKASQHFKFKVQGYGELPKSGGAPKMEATSSSASAETTKKAFRLTRTMWAWIALVLIAAIAITTWWRSKAILKARLKVAVQDPARVLREKLFELEAAKLNGEISADVYEKRQAEIRSSLKRLINS